MNSSHNLALSLAMASFFRTSRRRWIYLGLFACLCCWIYLGSDRTSTEITDSHGSDEVLSLEDSPDWQQIFNLNFKSQTTKLNDAKPGNSNLETAKRCDIYRQFENEEAMGNASCVSLKTPLGFTPICIHDPAKDTFISASLNTFGTWEPELLDAMHRAMAIHPDMMFVDLGANIGVYSLYMAKLGRKVVAVEPLTINIALLANSLKLGGLEGRVTMVNNAISDTRDRVALETPDGNIGGTFLQNMEHGSQKPTSWTILLDDLLEVVDRDASVALKIDVEGHELKVLKGGSQFLQNVDVKLILMEWILKRYDPNGMTVIDILLINGFLPFGNLTHGEVLDPSAYFLWPDNVFWVKR